MTHGLPPSSNKGQNEIIVYSKTCKHQTLGHNMLANAINKNQKLQ